MNYMILAKDMKNRKVLKIYIKYKKSYHIRRKLHEKNYEYIEIIAENKIDCKYNIQVIRKCGLYCKI